MQVKKKISIWKKGFDEKAFGVSLGKIFLKAILGEGVSAITDLPDLWTSVKGDKSDEELVFALIYDALISACVAEGKKYQEWFKKSDGKDNRDYAFYHDLGSSLDKALEEAEIEIDHTFIEKPEDSPFLIIFEEIFFSEFNKYILESQAKHISNEIVKSFPLWLSKKRSEKPELKSFEDRVYNKFSDAHDRILAYKNYRAEISSEYLKPVFEDEKMRLADIYIEPSFTIHQHCFEEKDPRLNKPLNYYQYKQDKDRFLLPFSKDNEKFSGNLHNKVSEFLNRKDSLELASKNAKVLLLLGHPGQGKTSFCKRLVHDISRGEEPFKKEVYFVKLRAIKKAKALVSDPLQVINDYLTPRSFSEKTMNVSRLSKSLLILDGLDELFMKEGLSYADIEELCKNLADETTDYPEFQVIITSRTAYVNVEKLKKRFFLVYHLGLLSKQQQLTFLDKYKAFNNCKLDKDKLNEIHENDKLKNIRELINQPIILQLVAKADYIIDANSSITSIYQELIRSLIKKLLQRTYSATGSLKFFENLTESHLERYLEAIALTVYQSDNEYIRKSDLEGLQETSSFMKSLKVGDLDEALKGLAISFYFQEVDPEKSNRGVDDENFAIEFIHKSLQEFLTASKIWNTFKEIGEKKSNGDFFLENWQNVLDLVFPVLSSKAMTIEVFNYLTELIKYEDKKVKDIITKRLSYFFPDLVKRDFLLKYDSDPKTEYKNSPINMAYNTFFGYWTVMACAFGSNDILLPDSIKEKLSFFLKIPLNANPFFLQNQKDLEKIDLSHTNLKETNFSRSNLMKASFFNSDLRDSIIDNSDLREANLSQAILIRVQGNNVNFEGANLSFSNIRHADLRNSNLNYTDLTNSYLHATNFSNCQLVKANLSHSSADAIFTNANLRRAQLVDCYCWDADFRGAVLFEANFRNSKLTNAQFDNADLSFADFSGVIGLNILQLSAAKSLYKTKGIPPEIEKEIRQTHPHLFENPKKPS